MDDNTLLSRMSGGVGCDLVTGTTEWAARRGRITAIIPAEDASYITNMTEEYPLSRTNRKRQDIITLTGTKGTATVICNGVSQTATFNTNLTTTASDFVTASAAAYLAVGLVLTSSGPALYFTASVAGVEFRSDSSISNLTTDLSGVIEKEYIKNTAVITGRSYMSTQQKYAILLTGTSGTANIAAGGVTKTATFSGSLATTASNFVSAGTNYADYLAAGIILSSSGAYVIFTAAVAGVDSITAPGITNASGDLAGSTALSSSTVVSLSKDTLIIPDYPLTAFTPNKGSFWIYYNYE